MFFGYFSGTLGLAVLCIIRGDDDEQECWSCMFTWPCRLCKITLFCYKFIAFIIFIIRFLMLIICLCVLEQP